MMQKCILCLKSVTNSDKQLCGHYVHNECLSIWGNNCPNCKNSGAMWCGMVEIDSDTIYEIKNLKMPIKIENIPFEISQQMGDASDNEKLLFAYQFYAFIFIHRDNLPRKMTLTQYFGGKFRQRLIY